MKKTKQFLKDLKLNENISDFTKLKIYEYLFEHILEELENPNTRISRDYSLNEHLKELNLTKREIQIIDVLSKSPDYIRMRDIEKSIYTKVEEREKSNLSTIKVLIYKLNKKGDKIKDKLHFRSDKEKSEYKLLLNLHSRGYKLHPSAHDYITDKLDSLGYKSENKLIDDLRIVMKNNTRQPRAESLF